MRQSIIRILDSPYVVRVAMIVTLALGYFFTLVWAPHPWSWQGIDAYHELAKSLARGEAFQTTDVPWGYAYYAAFFYWLFGDRIWIPLVVQATLNAAVPLLLYRIVAPLAGHRVAALSALITGVCSFNTIYASTQSSDTICTLLFLGGLWIFARGDRTGQWLPFAASGALMGLVPQFRPNMVLFPAVMIAGFLLMRPRNFPTLGRALLFGALVFAVQLPWIVRNYELTGMWLPTSTHGGIQLWYGTLQVGPHLESRAHNPRTHFAPPAFAYTSLVTRSIVITSLNRDCAGSAPPVRLVYWSDRDPQPRPIDADVNPASSHVASYQLPPLPSPSTLYYYFAQRDASRTWTTPARGAADPFVAFVSTDHLGDLDHHDDVLDVFDIIRLLRHIAWQEPLRAAATLDLNRDRRVDQADLNAIVTALLTDLTRAEPAPARVEFDADSVTLRLVDGSWIRVPRTFGGRVTDLDVSLDGEMAPGLLSRSRTFTSIALPLPTPADCLPAAEVTFNAPFYLAEPHMMLRYMSLAMDNIRRDPPAFALASAYRIGRLFIVRGTDDLATSQQFRWSAVVYAVGTALSVAYLAVFLAGVVISARRRSPLLVLIVPIVYVPLTICFVLTNMRYTVTVQPLMFAFEAVALAAALGVDKPARDGEAL